MEVPKAVHRIIIYYVSMHICAELNLLQLIRNIKETIAECDEL